MCKVLNVYRSSFSVWLKEPQSNAEKDNARLLEQIKISYYKVAVGMAVHASHMSCAIRVKYAEKTVCLLDEASQTHS
jgi:hypothetical protein